MPREFLAKVDDFTQRVYDAYAIYGSKLIASHNFVIALCNLLKDTPPEWGFKSRDLCLDEPPELQAVIDALHEDVDAHGEVLERAIPLHKLIRTAILLKHGALSTGGEMESGEGARG